MYSNFQDCNNSLILNQDKKTLRIARLITLYSSVNSSRFSELKSQLGGQGTFLIGEIPVTSGMDYKDFSNEVSKFTSIYKYAENVTINSDLQSSYLSELSVEAYKACIAANAALQGVGARIVLVEGNPESNSLSFRISYRAPDGDTQSREIRFDSKNFRFTQNSQAIIKDGFKGTDSAIVSGDRPQGLDFPTVIAMNVGIDVGGDSTSITVSARPRILARFKWKKSFRLSQYIHIGSGRKYYDEEKITPVPAGWFFDSVESVSKDGLSSQAGDGFGSADINEITVTDRYIKTKMFITSNGTWDAAASYNLSTNAYQHDWEDITDASDVEQRKYQDGSVVKDWAGGF